MAKPVLTAVLLAVAASAAGLADASGTDPASRDGRVLGRIGSPGRAFSARPLTAAKLRALLRPGPSRVASESPELGEPEQGRGRGDRAQASRTGARGPEIETSSATSPLPVTSWEATTGPAVPSGTKPKPATAQGTPPDPQIAVSS